MTNKIKSLLLFSLLAVAVACVVQAFVLVPTQETTVKWLDFKTAQALNKKKPKPMYIDVYTDWCGWCKRMDKDTFDDPSIAATLNKEFYPIKFNAEQSAPVFFNGKNFEKKSGERSHGLAVAMLNGQMSYPSTVFFNSKQEIITVVPGYLKPDDLAPILKFVSSGAYKTKTWEQYQQNLK
jgi:thioredoxin-related protein